MTPSVSSAWYAVSLLTLAYLISLLDRTVLNLLIGPLQQDLRITDTQFALLQGPTFAVFFLLGGLPIGWLVDRVSRIRIVTLGVAGWSVMTMLSGLASSFAHLFVMRIGVGVGEAALNPAAYSLMADLFSRDKLSRAIAVFSSGSMIGTGLAYAFGGGLLQLLGGEDGVTLPIVGTLRVWQVAFLAAGAPGLLLAALFLTVREPARKRREPLSAEMPLNALMAFLRDRRLVISLHFAAFSSMVVLAYSFFTWGPALLFRTHGLSPTVVGITMGVATGVCGVLGFFCGGALADRWLRKGHQDAHMRVGLWAMIATLPMGLIVALSGNAVLTTVGMCCLVFLMMTPTPAGIAGLQLITPPSLRGRVSALFIVVVNFSGMSLGPILVALITDYVFRSSTAVNLSLAIVTVVMTSISAVCFGLVRRKFGARIVEQDRISPEDTVQSEEPGPAAGFSSSTP